MPESESPWPPDIDTLVGDLQEIRDEIARARADELSAKEMARYATERIDRLKEISGTLTLAVCDALEAELRRVRADLSRSRANEMEARANAQRATERLERLEAISSALTSAVSAAQVARIVGDLGIMTLESQDGVLALVVGEGSELEIVRAIGYPDEFIETWSRFPLTVGGPLCDTIRTREPIWLESRAEIEARYPDLQSVTEGSHALAAIPLILDGRPIGAIRFTFDCPRSFPQDVREFVVALGRLRAQAIERARLYDAAQREIEERQRAEESMRHIAAVAQCLLWHAIIEDVDGETLNWRIELVDEEAARRYLPIEVPPGMSFAQAWEKSRIESDSERMDELAAVAVRENRNYRQEFRCRMADGSVRWLMEDVSVAKIDHGQWRAVGVCIDFTERKLAEQRIKEQMRQIHKYSRALERQRKALAEANERLGALVVTDGLTGLKNHRAFQERVEQEFYRSLRYTQPISLIVLDVDHFKDYNDTYGHPAGDEVLKRVSAILTKSARTSDFIARYGGEEFVLILPNTDAAGATTLAERFRQAVEAADWPHRRVTASFGVASRVPETLNAAQLIHEADAAMYAAKRGGRNRAIHFAALCR
jgi:diguanylate cyclase (GGDEF)-like protein